MKVSFIIGVLNEIGRLPRVVESIKAQRYPADSIEIIVADGGSDDGTVEYARGHGCKVIHNPLRRCEPGIALGYRQASGELAVIMAADNVLHGDDFIEHIVRPFSDTGVWAAVPRVVSTPEDGITNRYVNDFTDPFNHFIFGAAATPLTFARKYPIKRNGDGYVIYDFRSNEPPLIAMAQCLTLRAGLERRFGTEEDDVMPVMDLIEAGGEIAYVPAARVEHHTVRDLRDCVMKFRPRIAERLNRREMPVWQRATASRARTIRAYLWPFYSVSLVGPALVAVAGAINDRRATWLYHPVITTAFGIEFWRRYIVHLCYN